MSRQKSLKRLSKFMIYILGRRPDEFGLVLDADGFVKLKELLKAIHEEDGFKYVRRSHIEEILISQPDPPIEIKGSFIRAKDRNKLPPNTVAPNLPKLLYTCVRRRSYPVVLQKGILPTGYDRVVLSPHRELAERIGKRIDSQPILLTVQTQKSMDAGIMFYTAGESLFLADAIHPNCFTGPPLPQPKTLRTEPEMTPENKLPKYPGSYFVDLQTSQDRKKSAKDKKKGKTVAWKKNHKQKKRQKLKKERPPWRR